jgi:hypothetical protein
MKGKDPETDMYPNPQSWLVQRPLYDFILHVTGFSTLLLTFLRQQLFWNPDFKAYHLAKHFLVSVIAADGYGANSSLH